MTEKTYDEAESVARLAEHRAAPFLFLVLEGGRPASGGARFALGQVDEVKIGRGETRTVRRELADGVRRLTLAVPDARMSTAHVRITRTADRFVVEDLGSTNGTRLNGARIAKPSLLVDGDFVDAGRAFFRFRALEAASPCDASPAPSSSPLTTLLPTLEQHLEAIDRIARSPVSVLLAGETGTGKEIIARAVHELSGRRGAFVAVNCGALSETLLEAQLFGHVRGAFSGAVRDEDGYVRAADGGTLFLDEIADLPRSSQAALLRVLQEHEVVPVGSARPVRVDLRVVAATHRDLQAMMKADLFRSDLFARIAAFSFALPPLRERIEDLGVIVARLFATTGSSTRIAFGAEACRALVSHAWPLNIRELRQCIEVATVLAAGGVVQPEHLPAAIAGSRIAGTSEAPPATSSAIAEDDDLRRRLVAELARSHGNVAEVARAFGKARMQVQRWMKRFNLDPKTFR